MIEYIDREDASDNLRVEAHHDAVEFSVNYTAEPDQHTDCGHRWMLAILDRDSVTALVGQLQSWLDRTREK